MRCLIGSADRQGKGIIMIDRTEAFREMLDEIYEPYTLGELTFQPSDILESCDPVAFRVYLSDWESEEYPDDSTPVWMAGSNIPGYLPESDDLPYFVSQDEARAWLSDEISRHSESIAEQIDSDNPDDGTLERLSVAAAAIAEQVSDSDEYSGEFTVYVEDGRSLPVAYWVTCVPYSEAFGDSENDITDEFVQAWRDAR